MFSIARIRASGSMGTGGYVSAIQFVQVSANLEFVVKDQGAGEGDALRRLARLLEQREQVGGEFRGGRYHGKRRRGNGFLQVAGGLQAGQLSDSERRNRKDRLAESLNMSGRNLKRYLNLLDTPMEVQQAVTQKTLAMTLATRVGSLKKPVKDRIAAAIRAGRNPTRPMS